MALRSLLIASALSGLLGINRPALAAAPGPRALTEKDCAHDNRLIPDGQRASGEDLRLDAYCADVILRREAPHGMVTVFGSSRLGEGSPAYALVRDFAREWTAQQGVKGKRWPIVTGGGTGLMEAANRGAADAKGVSIALTTHFGAAELPSPHNAFTAERATYVFSSFSQREAELIDRASAIVIASGGIGTEWEIMETLCKLQTHKLGPMPVILLGPATQWKSLAIRLSEFAARGTIDRDDLKLLSLAETADRAIALILGTPADREKSSLIGLVK